MTSVPAATAANEALQKAAATPIEVDIDELQNAPTTRTNADSPTKRTKWDIQPTVTSAPALTLDQLTAQLATAPAPVTGGLQDMQKRIAHIEEEVMTKVVSALELIRTLDKRQKAMNEQVENMQEQIAAQAKETLTTEQSERKSYGSHNSGSLEPPGPCWTQDVEASCIRR